MTQTTQVSDSRTRTRRDLLLVAGGQVALLAIWFGATTLLARTLGPQAFGIYALCQTAIKLFTSCFGDPLDLAVMREAPIMLRRDRAVAMSLFRSAFLLRVLLGFIAILVAALAPSLISWVIFRAGEFHDLALMTAVGILTDLLLRSAAGFLQASQRFGQFMAVNATWQLSRAGGILALIFLGTISARAGLAVYIAAPLVAFAVAQMFLPSDLLAPRPPALRQVIDILHYGKWMAAATMLAALYERLDVFLLEWFKGQREVGIYAAAVALAMIPDFVNGAVQTVLAPRIAPAHAAGTFGVLYRRYLMYAAPLATIGLLAALALGGPIIRIFLSARYAESIAAFKILIAGTMFELVVVPLPAALLAFVAPRRVVVVNSIGLMIVACGGLTLIPRFGATGAAALILCTRIVTGCLTVALASKLRS